MPFPRAKWSPALGLALSALSLAGNRPAAAECPSDPPTAPPLSRAARPAAGGATQVQAHRAQSRANDVTELEGDAVLRRDGERLSADYLRYHRGTGQAEARGQVTLMRPGGGEFRAGEIQLNLDTGIGTSDAGTFRLPEAQGRGDMGHADFLDHDRTRLNKVRYTTCPAGRDDWYLRASTLDLDTEEDIGVARNVRLDFLGLPIFYLPYLSFPISNERKSGFLMPQIGYGSDRGAVLAAPYYLNLAPDYDATVTPRLMTERGLQLQGEFRYLGRQSNGRLEAEVLPNDKTTDEDRAAGTLLHRHTFDPYWSAAVDLRRVSDKDYLSDFGDTLKITSETHLPQNAELNYRGRVWNFTARAAGYQTIDRSIDAFSRPYARLPQLLLNARSPGIAGPQYRIDGELVHFHRDVGVIGERAHITPAVSLPLTRSYGFFVPEVGLHSIAYSLEGAADTRPGVTVPFAALDGGLVFERDLALGGGGFVHTLEPRLYYLYVRHRPQDHLPNFDTSIPDFTFDNLFRNNRFVGGDRVGDANQLTLALTTRVIDEGSGAERLRASIGRTHYFEQRRVNLPPGSVGDTSSDVAAEAVAWLAGNWYARTTVQWVPERDEAARSSYYLQYHPAADRILTVGHRFNRNDIDQADVSFEWPLGGRWIGRARSLYSLRDNENVESYAGLEYRACCWALRLYGARRLTQVTGAATATEQRGQVLLELELTGFAKSGGVPESPLKQGVFSFPTPPGRTPAYP